MAQRHSTQRLRRAGRAELLADVMNALVTRGGDLPERIAFLDRYEALKVRPGSTPVNPLSKKHRAALKIVADLARLHRQPEYLFEESRIKREALKLVEDLL